MTRPDRDSIREAGEIEHAFFADPTLNSVTVIERDDVQPYLLGGMIWVDFKDVLRVVSDAIEFDNRIRALGTAPKDLYGANKGRGARQTASVLDVVVLSWRELSIFERCALAVANLLLFGNIWFLIVHHFT